MVPVRTLTRTFLTANLGMGCEALYDEVEQAGVLLEEAVRPFQSALSTFPHAPPSWFGTSVTAPPVHSAIPTMPTRIDGYDSAFTASTGVTTLYGATSLTNGVVTWKSFTFIIRREQGRR